MLQYVSRYVDKAISGVVFAIGSYDNWTVLIYLYSRAHTVRKLFHKMLRCLTRQLYIILCESLRSRNLLLLYDTFVIIATKVKGASR